MNIILPLVILSLACLSYGCQEKEELEPDLETMVQLEEDEKDEDWEFEGKDSKAVASENERFVQEIIIQEELEKPTLEQDPAPSLR